MSLSWNLEDLAVASGAAPSTPVAPSHGRSAPDDGKSSGTSGGGGKLVSLFVVRSVDSVCCGFIGNGRAKICLTKSCGVQSHLSKFVFPDGVDALVFIGTGAGTSVWSSPYVEPSAFGAAWERYKAETRSATSWQVLFEALINNPRMSEAEVTSLGDDTKIQQPAYTPFKRRRLANLLASPSESEESFQDVTFIPLATEEGPSQSMSVESVLRQWRTLGMNLDILHGMASTAKRGNRELEDLLSSTTNQLGVKIGAIRAVLGERTSELGTVTAFQLLRSHGDDLSDLDAAVKLLVNRMSNNETKEKEAKESFRAELYGDFAKALDPLRRLFAVLSSDMHTPGNLLRAELDSVKRDVQQLAASSVGGAPAFAKGPNLAWNLGPTSPAPIPSPAGAVTPGPPTPAPLLMGDAECHALSRRVKQIEQQLDSQTVKVGMQTFSSRQDAEAWLKLTCPATGAHAYFLDFHSLLALAFGPGASTAEILKMEESRTRLNFTTTEEAIVTSSFHMEIPAFFGKASTLATTLSSKVLPGLQTFDSWDMGDGDRGLRYDLKHKVQERVEAWTSSSEFTLPTGAQLVAQAMLHGAESFIEFVSNWITQFFGDCKTKGADEMETWRHISHTIRELCSILHHARRAGRGPFLNSSDRASSVFWGQLQAHREMQTIMKRGLMGDPRLSHILNLHLRDNAVMKSEFNKLSDTIRSMAREIAELKKKKKPVVLAGGGGRGAGGAGRGGRGQAEESK